jgi:hypothetical protein
MQDKYRVKIISRNTRLVRINGYKYLALPHESEYKIRMFNDHNNRVNAEVKIDGEEVGTWRIEPRTFITISRPADNKRKFVFVAEGSREGNMGGVKKGRGANGLIEVKFIPEMILDNISYICNDDSSCLSRRSGNLSATNNMSYGIKNNSLSFSSGGTVLGGHSRQNYGTAGSMILDYKNEITKVVRLIIDEDNKKYIPIRKSERVPPRIDKLYSDSDDDITGYADEEMYYSEEDFFPSRNHERIDRERDF